MDPLELWPTFAKQVRDRLEMGRDNYKDESFSKMPSRLALEVDEELFDVCAWTFILWARLYMVKSWILKQEEK